MRHRLGGLAHCAIELLQRLLQLRIGLTGDHSTADRQL
jgi:hypothetical protein